MSTNKNKEIKVAGGGELVVGHEYEIRHSRKGTFTAIVDQIEGEWIDVTLTSGKERCVSRERIPAEAGDTLTIRDVHSYFIPIPAAQTTAIKETK